MSPLKSCLLPVAALLLAAHHPLWPRAAAAALLLWCAAAWRFPRLWLFVAPAALPIANLAPWTGWIGLEELDLLLLGAAAAGQYVYIYGGGTSTTTGDNQVWRWDSTTETWTQLANMPTAKQNIQGAYWNGKIYVPGGYTSALVHITENAIYDIAANTWSTGAPLPTGKSPATAAWNGKIFAFGGNPGPTNTTYIYDIATNMVIALPEPDKKAEEETALYKLVVKGEPLKGAPGRIDDFAWPPGERQSQSYVGPPEPGSVVFVPPDAPAAAAADAGEAVLTPVSRSN